MKVIYDEMFYQVKYERTFNTSKYKHYRFYLYCKNAKYIPTELILICDVSVSKEESYIGKISSVEMWFAFKKYDEILTKSLDILNKKLGYE